MKRILSAIAFLLVCNYLQAQSDIELSLELSPSLNWMNSDEKTVDKGQMILGYDFGLHANFYFKDSKNYSFGTGILITTAGGELQYKTENQINFAGETLEPYSKVKYHTRYLEIPTVIKMKTSQFHRTTFWGQFGLSNMINIGSKGTSNDRVLDKTNISDEVKMFNMSLNVGAGFEFDLGGGSSVTAGLIFKNGFLDVTSNSDISDKTIMNSIKMNLGIVF